MRPLPPSLSERPLHPHEGAESLGDNMYTAIDEAFDDFWKQEFVPGKYITDEDIAGRREGALSRERKFAEKVCGAVLEMAERHEGVITILFDVDETIVKKYFYADDTGTMRGRDVARPAFTPTIQALDSILGDRLEIGLLTSRGQSHLDKELINPTFLGEVIHKVNPEFVVSSRDGAIAQDPEINYIANSNSHQTRRDALKDFVDLEKVTEDDLSSPYNWFNSKLLILRQIASQNPDRAFIFVEDLPCASVIDPSNPQVRGIQTYEDSGFFSI